MKVGDLVNVKYATNVKFGVIFRVYVSLHGIHRGSVVYSVLWDNGEVSPKVIGSALRVIHEGR